MKHAELCPVCQGKGELPLTFPANAMKDSSATMACHGCDRKGWVEVDSGCGDSKGWRISTDLKSSKPEDWKTVIEPKPLRRPTSKPPKKKKSGD